MNILLTAIFYLGFTSNFVPMENLISFGHKTEVLPGPEVVLHLKSTLISGNTVKIGYEIPYPGYIEFLLFDKEGKMLWYNAYVKDKGDHFLAFKREKLESGISYTFTLRYKGKDYPGTFVNN